MHLTVNGTERQFKNETTVSDLLRSIQIDPASARGIAVALNDRIVRKADWESKVLSDGDRVEVVTAQQGG
ncbi:MAG: sulfur carrier protein ThiS [Bacteroidetes bacterium]|nr:MAG: sulfur carrier protein ThiS [Bacteroidota bacterium]